MEVTVELGPEIEMGVSLLQKRAEDTGKKKQHRQSGPLRSGTSGRPRPRIQSRCHQGLTLIHLEDVP